MNKQNHKNTILCITVTNIIYIYIYICMFYSIFEILIKIGLKQQKDKLNIKTSYGDVGIQQNHKKMGYLGKI